MNLLHAPPFDNTHSNRELPRVIREFHALQATTIDARRFSILVAHWPGILVVNGRLAVNDDSPLVQDLGGGHLTPGRRLHEGQ